MIRTTTIKFRRLRTPALIFMVAALMHVAFSPALPHDCGDEPAHHHGHDSGHACCHAPCCQAGEPAGDVNAPRLIAPASPLAVMPELARGRDVIFQLFRPPQSPSLSA